MWNLGEPELSRVEPWGTKLYWKNPKLFKLLGNKIKDRIRFHFLGLETLWHDLARLTSKNVVWAVEAIATGPGVIAMSKPAGVEASESCKTLSMEAFISKKPIATENSCTKFDNHFHLFAESRIHLLHSKFHWVKELLKYFALPWVEGCTLIQESINIFIPRQH